jgi:hypothetical protein
VRHAPQLFESDVRSTQPPEQQAPVEHDVPSMAFVHAVLLKAGWHFSQVLVGFVMPLA